MKKRIIGQYRVCDIITMLGTLFAIIGIILSLKGHFHLATLLMIGCAICDSVDGYFARKRNNTEFESTYGAELDSLSDMISFGVFPAIFVYKISYYSIAKYIIPIFILSGLIRLTYFNSLHITKKDEKGYFRGVPITVSAFLLPILYVFTFFNYKLYSSLIIVALIALSILYVTNIKIKKPNISTMIDYFKKTRYHKIIRVFINFVLFPMFIILISDLFFKTNSFVGFAPLDVFKSVINYPKAFLLVYGIFLLTMILFTSIFKNTNRSKFVLLILMTIFLIINDVKYIIMNSPVMLSDINFLNASNMDVAGTYLNTVLGIWIIKVIVKASILVFILILFKKSKLSLIELSKKVRIILFASSLLALYLLFAITTKYSSFMVENIYNYNIDNVIKIENYSNVYYEQGLYQGIMFNKYTSYVFKPSSYDKDKAKELLKNTQIETEDWGKPNIVIILSESFSDVTNISEVKFKEDVLKNIHKLEKQADALVTDTLITTYGGQSVNSEWEVQTSASNFFYIPTYIVYNEYYNKNNLKNIKKSPHIIHSLSDYDKKYITPWGGDSYNSENVYTFLGIDEVHYNLEGEIKGLYLSDHEISKSILKELKEDSTKPKLLIYATGENHMPCSKNKFDKYNINIKSSTYNKENTDLIRCYAQGVHDADHELGYLYDEIKKINKNTIVIFFGDHLPYITNKKGENMYLESEYFTSSSSEEEYYLRTHTTKSVIFSNYGLQFDKSIKYINLSYLGAYVYSHLNIKDKEYYNFINNSRKVLPVYSRNFIYDTNNNRIINFNDISKEQKKTFDNLRNVQYYKFFDND